MPPNQHADLICGVLPTNKRLIFRLVDSFNTGWQSCGGRGNTGHQHQHHSRRSDLLTYYNEYKVLFSIMKHLHPLQPLESEASSM